VEIYGVHPRPPSLLQDTTERDIELIRVATKIKERGEPAIVLGDLNDVAWSPTTAMFMKTGGLLDPRRGRGFSTLTLHVGPGFVIHSITYSVRHILRSVQCACCRHSVPTIYL